MDWLTDWLGTVSWAEFSVGGVVVAIIVGLFQLRGKSMEGRSKLSSIDRSHQKELEKLRAEKLEAEHWLTVEKAKAFSSKLHELSSAVKTVGQTQIALSRAGNDKDLVFAYDVSDAKNDSDPGKLVGKHGWLELEWQKATEKVETLYPLIETQIQELKTLSRDMGGKAEKAYHGVLIVTNEYTAMGPSATYKMGEEDDQTLALEKFDASIEQFKHNQIIKPKEEPEPAKRIFRKKKAPTP